MNSGDSLVYSEERVSWIIVVVGVLAELAVLLHLMVVEETLLHYLLAALILLMTLATYNTTILLTKEFLYIHWGMGLLSRTVFLADVESRTIVPNRSVCSWLYNPLGDDALELRGRSGGRVLLPVANPKKMQQMLQITR